MVRCFVITLFILSFTIIFADGTQPFGAGTSSSPYEIETLNNLLWLSTNSTSWSSHFIQTADIDATTTSSWNGGEGFSPIGNGSLDFTGTYDGDSYEIENLFIDRAANDQGLFGRVNGATIQNLGVTDCSITGNTRVGAIASLCIGSSDILNCYSTGSITGAATTGGLVGFLRYSSSISQCWSICSVTAATDTGGLVGKTNNSAVIEFSYARGTVTGTSFIGGLLGENQASTVQFCYSTGLVNGSTTTGGIVGYSDNMLILCSLWDTDTSGQATSSGGLGLGSSDMKLMEIYQSQAWDFMIETDDGTNDIWGMNGLYNDGYPFLAWEDHEHFPPAGTQPNGGGISSNPYTITQLDHLLWVSSHVDSWDKYFRMASNIDASDTQNWTGGDGFRPIGHSTLPFTGTYDGNDYRISDLYIDRTNTNNQGMFGYTQSALIHDLRLINVSISGATRVGGLVGSASNTYFLNCKVTGEIEDGYTNVGGLAGIISNSCTLEGCESDVTIYGRISVGGLVGKAGASTITGCTAEGSVDSFYDGAGFVGSIINNTLIENSSAACTVTGNNQGSGFVTAMDDSVINCCYCISDITVGCGNVGGFVGKAEGSSMITNSYNQGTIASCTNSTGGFAAQMMDTSTIENCYSACTITGSSYNCGGFVCDLFNTPHVINSFWDTELSGLSTSDGGTGLTTTEMQELSTYYNAGWDFAEEISNGEDNYWGLNASENNGYPFLMWQGYTHTAGNPEAPVGSGTEGDPYQIGTASQLKWLSSTSSVWGAYFVQTQDIDLSASSQWDNGSGWTPIGNDATNFTGNYDGQTHSIDGLFVDRAVGYQGFFGYLNGADVSNVLLTNIDIACAGHTGGLVGYSYDSNISGCSAGGTITSLSNQLGLLAGIAEASTVENCATSGTINGYDDVGGLIGYCTASFVTSCSSVITVNANENAGGSIGRANNSSQILESSCSGTITAFCAGGFIGRIASTTVERCYAMMDVTASYIGGGFFGSSGGYLFAQDCFSQCAIVSDYGSAAGFLYSAASYDEFISCYSACSFTNTNAGFIFGYPSHVTITDCIWDKDLAGNTTNNTAIGMGTAEMKSYVTYYLNNWDMIGESDNGIADIWGINPDQNNGYPFLSWQGFDNTYPGLPAGSGTTEDPYQISDFSHLYWMSCKSDILSSHFIQTADIDASISASYNDGKGLDPIGTSAGYFMGTYNGQDYAIDGFTIDRSGSPNQALFGYVVYGTIRNVRLTNCSICGDSESGCLAGRIEESTIDACYVSGQITGQDLYCAGIAGMSIISTITGSHNAADVIGNTHIGGIVGWSQETNIDDCCNTGPVEGWQGIGGICGKQLYGLILNSCNLGTITSSHSNGGGVAGEAVSTEIYSCCNKGEIFGQFNTGGCFGQIAGTTVEECYSTGDVDSFVYSAGFVGDGVDGSTIRRCFSTGEVTGTLDPGGFIAARENCVVRNCFYDTEASGMTTSAAGTGLPTADMKDLDTFMAAGWDFMGETLNGTDNFWKLDGVNNNGYPLLSWEEGTPVAPASPENVVITVENGQVHITWDIVPYVDSYRVFSGAAPDGLMVEDTTGTFDNTTWTAPLTHDRRFYMLTSHIEDETRNEEQDSARKEDAR